MMRRAGTRCLPIGVTLLAMGPWTTEARADGGALRVWTRQGGYEIAAFTDPTPFVAGPVDISILLLDPATGAPISGASVLVDVAPEGHAAMASQHVATVEAATNKLLRAAVFDLPAPGRYKVGITVDGPPGRARVRFEVDASAPSGPRAGLLAWALWPVPIVALYGVHRIRVARKLRPRGAAPRPAREVSTGD